MCDWNDEEAVRVVQDTSQRIIPRQESSEEPKDTTCFDTAGLGNAHIVVLKVADTEEEKCHIKGEEEGEECNRGAQGCNQEDGGEDKPALKKGVFGE